MSLSYQKGPTNLSFDMNLEMDSVAINDTIFRDSRILVLHDMTFPLVGVMIGNTDTKRYLNRTQNIYRFSPTYMFPEDLKVCSIIWRVKFWFQLLLGVLIGNTDTKHYLNRTQNIYRFSPTYIFPDDLKVCSIIQRDKFSFLFSKR